MPDRLDISGLQLTVPTEPLTAAAFAPFGDVIENPRPDVQPSQYAQVFGSGLDSKETERHPFSPVSANQGSAIKYQRVSALADRYAADRCASGTPSAPLASMFVCSARTLLPENLLTSKNDGGGLFHVTILERHPYTTQTFVPLATGSSSETRYLVIVAPTRPEGNRPPDVRGIKAFIARGDQAVTYGAGTWHAPMAALGAPGTLIPYFVFQFANGVGPEDCQEVLFDCGRGYKVGQTSSVVVRVPPPSTQRPAPAKPSNYGLWSKL